MAVPIGVSNGYGFQPHLRLQKDLQIGLD